MYFIYVTKLTLIASVYVLVLPCVPANAENGVADYRKTFESKHAATNQQETRLKTVRIR